MVVKPKSTIGAKGAIQTMLMKYAAIVTYTDGSKTGAAILAEERECKA